MVWYMMMMERNSDEIAAVIAEWMSGSQRTGILTKSHQLQGCLPLHEPKVQLKIDQLAVRYSRDGGDL
jgi:hypothetical protein